MKATSATETKEARELRALSSIEQMLSRQAGLAGVETHKDSDIPFVAATFNLEKGIRSNPVIIRVQVMDELPNALHLDSRAGRSFPSLNCVKLINDINDELIFGKLVVCEIPEIFFYRGRHLFVGSAPEEKTVGVLIREVLSAQIAVTAAVLQLWKFAQQHKAVTSLMAADPQKCQLN